MRNDQITVIEEKLAHQDHSLQVMNDTIVTQQRQIELLLERVGLLEQQMQTLAQAGGIDVPATEVPPHY